VFLVAGCSTRRAIVFAMAGTVGLKALEHAERLAIECNLASRDFPDYEQPRLGDQLRRAAQSAALNIAEGACKTSYREYRRYLETSHTSLKEVGMALRIAHGSQYITDDRFKELMALLDETSRTLYWLMRSVSLKIERGEKNR
jgi:four helix bundle protein